MEYALLAWPPDGTAIDLDHERFAYAGKFVTAKTAKAIATAAAEIVAAVAFDADRTDSECLRIRYVTVREDRRGEGIGANLLRLVVVSARDRDFSVVRAGVNNPFAYEAFYKAGLAYTGEQTGMAELVCSTAADRDSALYRAGLATFSERDLSDQERAFLDARTDAVPPLIVVAPNAESDDETVAGDSNQPGT